MLFFSEDSLQHVFISEIMIDVLKCVCLSVRVHAWYWC